jgi:hypothetical protein
MSPLNYGTALLFAAAWTIEDSFLDNVIVIRGGLDWALAAFIDCDKEEKRIGGEIGLSEDIQSCF